jgi:type II secretory pathway pseudopilin PulG
MPATTRLRGFSLMEVMLAIGVFFIASFAILGLVANTISNVRRLQRAPVDAGVLAAELSVTNKLTEGDTSGNLGESLGKQYSDYTWIRHIQVAPPAQPNQTQGLGTVQQTPQSTKLFEVDFAILAIRTHEVVSKVSFYMYAPLSDATSFDGGMHHP